MTELDLQKYVVGLLRFTARPNVLWFAVPNGEARSARTGAKLKAMGVLAGVSDLIVIVHGRAHFLELKTAKGRQSLEQRAFQSLAINSGSAYAVARSPEAARNILEVWRAIPSVSRSLHEEAA